MNSHSLKVFDHRHKLPWSTEGKNPQLSSQPLKPLSLTRAQLQSIIAEEVLYNCAMFSIKTSVLYLWALGIFVFGYGFVRAGLSIIQCHPLSYIWDPSVAGGYCGRIPLAGTITAASNVLTDIIILVMPMPVLWKLQMEMRMKLQIMGIFLLGGLYALLSI